MLGRACPHPGWGGRRHVGRSYVDAPVAILDCPANGSEPSSGSPAAMAGRSLVVDGEPGQPAAGLGKKGRTDGYAAGLWTSGPTTGSSGHGKTSSRGWRPHAGWPLEGAWPGRARRQAWSGCRLSQVSACPHAIDVLKQGGGRGAASANLVGLARVASRTGAVSIYLGRVASSAPASRDTDWGLVTVDLAVPSSVTGTTAGDCDEGVADGAVTVWTACEGDLVVACAAW